MSVRASVITLAAIAATAVAPHAATAGSVIAYGELRDGVCVFATDVHVPAGFAAHASDSCEVSVEPISVPDAPTVNAGGGVDALPKTPTHGVASGAASPNLVSLSPDAGTLGAASYRSKIAFTELIVKDGLNRTMYDDSMQYVFQRRVSDNAIYNAAPYGGLCETGQLGLDPFNPDPFEVLNTSAPYDPYVTECYSNTSVQTTNQFVWDSAGWYGATLGVFGVGLREDYRNMGEHWYGDRSGLRRDLSYCDLGGSLPTGWWNECIIGEGDWSG